MPDTEKLYYAQPPIEVFTSTVLDCQPAKGGFWVELASTAFYPEGGGQPADRGTLGGAKVLDVQIQGACIRHLTDSPLTVGDTAEGRIDMVRRRDNTQQHSGEHVLMGFLHQMYGAENVGFHISEDVLTLDTSCPVPVEGFMEAERRANELIWQDVQLISEIFTDPEELEKQTYRSKKELEGPVRLVTIPGADCCACCGTHVDRTGQIGMIKILDWQHYKQGVRLFVVCGDRALKAFEARRERCAAIGQTLSAKFDTLTQSVQRQKDELEKAKYRVIYLENQMFARTAQSWPADQPVILQQEGLEPDGLRRLAAAFGQERPGFCALFSPNAAGCSFALADPTPGADLRPLCKAMNQAFSGRGGGKPGFVQGSLARFDFSAIDTFLREFLNHENAL